VICSFVVRTIGLQASLEPWLVMPASAMTT
jgi:hypothetical protein